MIPCNGTMHGSGFHLASPCEDVIEVGGGFGVVEWVFSKRKSLDILHIMFDVAVTFS